MSTDRNIRIASGQGFWGDRLDAPVEQVRRGPIDYLMLDYLAEVTMSILQKQRSRDPAQGYARDFVPLMGEILPDCVEKNIRVLANAGGVNLPACRDAVLEEARKAGLRGKVRVGVVHGDDILDRLEDLIARGHELRNMDTGQPLTEVLDRVQSANAYIGARPMVEALRRGATVVITGRSTDTALTYAPMIHAFGWAPGDYDKLAAGVVAGHINECGAQASGGNCPGLAVDPEPGRRRFPSSKPRPTAPSSSPSTTGRRPRQHRHGHRTARLRDGRPRSTSPRRRRRLHHHPPRAGRPDRVRVHGVKGRPPTDKLKVSISYTAGYKAVGTLVYAWPDAAEKAMAADRILRERLDRLGLRFDEIRTEFVGWNATHGPLAGPPPADLPEVQLRVAVRAADRAPVERFTREIAPLILTGPPSVTGLPADPGRGGRRLLARPHRS